MVKTWDTLMKLLMQASPQDLVSWICGDAVYEGELNTEIQKDPIHADLLYTVKWKGKQVVLHVEFQKRQDNNMGERVWDYNVLTYIHTRLPVYSIVIYLVKDSPIVESPYIIPLPTGEAIHSFAFQNIKLWEIPPEVLVQQNLPGLWPLLPLTHEGNRREVVEPALGVLQRLGRKDLIGGAMWFF